MIDRSTFQWIIGILTIIILGAIVFLMLELLRMQWRRIAKTKLLIEIRTPIATIEKYLVGRQENILSAKGTDGNIYDYEISEKDIYRDDYPAGVPSFMQSVIGKAYYDEGVTTPNTRKQTKDASADARILARAREKAQLDADARELNRASGGGGSLLGNSSILTVILLIVITLASLAGAYFSYTGMNASVTTHDALIGTGK